MKSGSFPSLRFLWCLHAFVLLSLLFSSLQSIAAQLPPAVLGETTADGQENADSETARSAPSRESAVTAREITADGQETADSETARSAPSRESAVMFALSPLATPTFTLTPTATPTATPTPTATLEPCGPIEVTGGTINVDTTWYGACSPYVVTGSILVSSGVTLTIEAGVEVKFAGSKAMQINGTLIARGTSANPIVFTSNAANPAPGDWVYIFFADSSTDATLDANGNYVSGSVLEYCEVRYGGGTGSAGAVQLDGAGPFLDESQSRVAAVLNAPQVKTFYRPIGGSTYTEQTMSLRGGLYLLWIPASQMSNGVEYYFQVEDADGNVLATLPESNPSTQPFSLPVVAQLQENVTAGQDNALEFAVGLAVEIPAGALASDTQLRVAPPAAAPSPPAGVTATDIRYALTLANGSTTFAQSVTVTCNYADSDVAGMTAADLRAYYLDNGAVKYAGGTVDTTAQTVTFQTSHFTDFFLAEGSTMYPAPVTLSAAGSPITIQASVVNYVPVHSATLHYRVGAAGAWQSLTMSQSGTYYEATIPAGDVSTAGVAYYIQASDGTTTATFPASDPVNNPQVINVPDIPAAISDLSATQSGGNVVLNWSHSDSNADHYEIWRADDTPYFTPGDPGSSKIADVTPGALGSPVTYSDAGSKLDNPASNSFYVVRAVNAVDQASAITKRVGEFDFALARDAYNTITLPLGGSSLATADDLGAATGATVVSRWVPATQSLDSRIVGGAGENFALSAGAAYFVYTPGSGPTTFSLVGEVPAAGSVQFTIERADACRLNLISLPLDQAGISSAEGLATVIGGVTTVSQWQASTGSFSTHIAGIPTTDFAIRIGYPYWLCADASGGGATWP